MRFQNLILTGRIALAALLVVSLEVAAAPQSAVNDQELMNAIMRFDRAGVSALLKQGINVNRAQGDGATALHWAVQNDDVDIVRMLLEAGANVRSASRFDAITPLYLAATNGNAPIIDMLVKAGADVSRASGTGITPLMRAAASGNEAAVMALLDNGANIHAKDPLRGQNAAMFAAAMNRHGVIRLLASRGADLESTSEVLLISERPAGQRTLTAPEEILIKEKEAGEDGETFEKEVLSNGSMGGWTALHYAVREGHMETVRTLIELGANLNHSSAYDRTTPMMMAIINGYYDIAKFLLDHEADPNLQTVDGLTALYATIDTEYAPVSWSAVPHTWADGTGQQQTTYLELMKALLDSGADPNARIKNTLWFRPIHHDQMWVPAFGSSVFWRAAYATDVAAMKLLIAYGANPRVATPRNDTPLHMAAGVAFIGNFTINAPDPDGYLASVKYLVEELGLDVNAVDAVGYTPLHGAALRGDPEVIKYLVSKGANVKARNIAGWSVTDMAMGPSLRSAAFLMEHPDTRDLLMSLGAPAPMKSDEEERIGTITRKVPVAEEPKASTPK